MEKNGVGVSSFSFMVENLLERSSVVPIAAAEQ
jgi:hypothetical protein